MRMNRTVRMLALLWGLGWMMAAAAQSPDFRQGWEAYQSKDYSTAIRFLVMAADEGDARAALALADIHERGLGTPRDPEQAARWRRLADQLGGVQPSGDETDEQFWRRRALEAEKREWQHREEIRRLEADKRKAPPREVRRSQSLHWGYGYGYGPRFHDPFWGPGWGWGPAWGWGYPGPGIHFGYSQGWIW
jgi:hypothetical protein